MLIEMGRINLGRHVRTGLDLCFAQINSRYLGKDADDVIM